MSARRDWLQDTERLARLAKFQPGRLADLCRITPRHLRRVFLERYQTTPGRWLRELQCELALELKAVGWSNKAVAAKLGFASEAHFCREFKKQFGITPGHAVLIKKTQNVPFRQ